MRKSAKSVPVCTVEQERAVEGGIGLHVDLLAIEFEANFQSVIPQHLGEIIVERERTIRLRKVCDRRPDYKRLKNCVFHAFNFWS